MPLYEYVCRACGAEVERLQKFSDPPLADCPDCGKPELNKKISAAGFRLKGGGWYETDFKKDKRRNLAAGSGAAESAAGGGGAESKSSESKGKDTAGSGSESTTKTDSKKADSKKDSGSKKAAGS